MHTLTTINVQGDDQEAFEVYADDTKEQTIGFVFDERIARLLSAATRPSQPRNRDELGYIALGSDEERSSAECGCELIACQDHGDDSGPAFYLCKMHGAAPRMLDALRDAIGLMPLGTAKRAEWIRTALAVCSKATSDQS